MSLEHDSEPNKVTPLSQARLGRKSSNMNDLTEDKPITEGRLKEVLSEFVFNPLVVKLTRIEKSINQIVSQFEAIRSGKAEDAALRVTTDHNAADLALAGIDLPKEEYYPYTWGASQMCKSIRL